MLIHSYRLKLLGPKIIRYHTKASKIHFERPQIKRQTKNISKDTPPLIFVPAKIHLISVVVLILIKIYAVPIKNFSHLTNKNELCIYECSIHKWTNYLIWMNYFSFISLRKFVHNHPSNFVKPKSTNKLQSQSHGL